MRRVSDKKKHEKLTNRPYYVEYELFVSFRKRKRERIFCTGFSVDPISLQENHANKNYFYFKNWLS
jgi:hypothetical protein